MTFQVEMRWRCGTPDCATEMLGRFKKCSRCGKPKGDEPFYDAPGPVTRAQAITDAKLLKQAKAGKDFKCKYCRCAERRDSGECSNCGAPAEESIVEEPEPIRIAPLRRDCPTPPGSRLPMSLAFLTGAIVIGILLGWLFWWLLSPKEVTARVAAREWTYTVQVERYQAVADEGFAEDRPADAVDVAAAGRKVHHKEKVPDGTEPKKYTDYDDPYECGEDCKTTPISCVPNDNGFKTCSGGKETCKKKICYPTKTREVPKFKDEPVYENWYRWKVWRWKHDRDVSESGNGAAVKAPSEAKVALNQNLASGQRERFSDHAAYKVVFVEDDGDRHEYRPATLQEFQSLNEGKVERLSVGLGSVEIVGRGKVEIMQQ